MIFTLICTDRDGARELHSYRLYVQRAAISSRLPTPDVDRGVGRRHRSESGPSPRVWRPQWGLPMISVAVFFVSAKQEPAVVSLDRWLNLAE